jgi:hypothetical protein
LKWYFPPSHNTPKFTNTRYFYHYFCPISIYFNLFTSMFSIIYSLLFLLYFASLPPPTFYFSPFYANNICQCPPPPKRGGGTVFPLCTPLVVCSICWLICPFSRCSEYGYKATAVKTRGNCPTAAPQNKWRAT